jgi:TolB-like protein
LLQNQRAQGLLPIKITAFIRLAFVVAVIFFISWALVVINSSSVVTKTSGLPAAPGPAHQSIAILPFTDNGSDAGQSFFAKGFAEDLIINLSEIADLRVISSPTSFAVPNRDDDATSITRYLKARYLVDGSVRRYGDQIRISVQLIDGIDGTNIWANRYDGKNSEILAFRDDVLNMLTKSLSLRLSQQEKKRFQRRGTENVAAFEALLRGRRAISQFSPHESLNAERYFRQAIELDPDYALAHASLAQVFAIRFENNWTKTRLADEEKAFYFANRALKLDNQLAFAEYTLGRLYSVTENSDMSAAAYHLKRAIELQPHNDDARIYYAAVLNISGQPEAAIHILEAVIGGHPSPPF